MLTGDLWGYWRTVDGLAHNALLVAHAAAVSSFGEDNAGELYVTDFGGGMVYRLMTE